MLPRCMHCKQRLHREDSGSTLIDDTGGDVCPVASLEPNANRPHELHTPHVTDEEKQLLLAGRALAVIKAVRDRMGWDLKTTVDFVRSMPEHAEGQRGTPPQAIRGELRSITESLDRMEKDIRRLGDDDRRAKLRNNLGIARGAVSAMMEEMQSY